ncbi:MAG: radical SAM protein [Candidatus Omnitrophota bacterium]
MDKLKRALQREMNYIFKRPAFAHLEVTYRCNLSCGFCGFREGAAREKRDELSTGQWRSVIDELKGLGVGYVTLVGAEPLIRKDIVEIIAHIKGQGMKCLLLTNGILLDRQKTEELSKCWPDKITVSIDGPEEVHDKIRGINGVFKKATQGLANLKAERDRTGSRLPVIGIHATICSTNVGHLDNIIGIYRELGIDEVSFQYITETGEDVINREIFNNEKIGSRQFIPQCGSFLLDEDGVRVMRETADRLQGKGINNFSMRTIRCISPALLTKGCFPVKKCYTANTDIHIDPYGSLHPCALTKNYNMGNAVEDGLSKVWTGKRAEDFRAHLHKRLLGVCRYCCHFNSNLTFGQAAKVLLGKELK